MPVKVIGTDILIKKEKRTGYETAHKASTPRLTKNKASRVKGER